MHSSHTFHVTEFHPVLVVRTSLPTGTSLDSPKHFTPFPSSLAQSPEQRLVAPLHKAGLCWMRTAHLADLNRISRLVTNQTPELLTPTRGTSLYQLPLHFLNQYQKSLCVNHCADHWRQGKREKEEVVRGKRRI